MNTAAAFQYHPEPGVFYIKESSASYPVSLDRLLADGTRIASPENAHLLETVDYIVSREYAAQPIDAVQQGTAVQGIVGSFAMLIQWMKCHDLHYFGHLTQWHVEQYLKDCSLGVEHALDAERRVRQVLADKSRRFKTRREIYEAAGLSWNYKGALPTCKTIISHYLASGSVLPATELAPQERLTKNLLWLRAQVFGLLWRYRQHVPDPLGQEPSAPALEALVAKYGRQGGSTPCQATSRTDPLTTFRIDPLG